jgi:hypothetical protein
VELPELSQLVAEKNFNPGFGLWEKIESGLFFDLLFQ